MPCPTVEHGVLLNPLYFANFILASGHWSPGNLVASEIPMTSYEFARESIQLLYRLKLPTPSEYLSLFK